MCSTTAAAIAALKRRGSISRAPRLRPGAIKAANAATGTYPSSPSNAAHARLRRPPAPRASAGDERGHDLRCNELHHAAQAGMDGVRQFAQKLARLSFPVGQPNQTYLVDGSLASCRGGRAPGTL
jgi:hypothetical protein